MFYLTDFDLERNVDANVAKYAKNYHSDRYLFRLFNQNSPVGHSANGILRCADLTPYAVKCNCGHATYHPLLSHREVDWRPEVVIKEKNKNLIEKRFKQLWIREL